MKIAIVHDLAECITGDIVPEKYSVLMPQIQGTQAFAQKEGVP